MDGAIRDKNEISKLEYPVFAKKGVAPRGPYKDILGEINIPIACGVVGTAAKWIAEIIIEEKLISD